MSKNITPYKDSTLEKRTSSPNVRHHFRKLRRIKPSNIIWNRHGEKKVLNFRRLKKSRKYFRYSNRHWRFGNFNDKTSAKKIIGLDISVEC
jgi:hypothetical protein